MASQTKKIRRRMDEVSRVMANQHRAPLKEYAKRQKKVERRNKNARAFILGALHLCGHEAYAPKPVMPLRIDRFHANIGARGTTISEPNLGGFVTERKPTVESYSEIMVRLGFEPTMSGLVSDVVAAFRAKETRRSSTAARQALA